MKSPGRQTTLPLVTAVAFAVGSAGIAAGLTFVAEPVLRQLAADGWSDPARPLLALAAVAGALVAARLCVCAAATVFALLASALTRPAPTAVRVALATSPRALRPALAVLLAGGLALSVAAPAVASTPTPRAAGAAATTGLPAPGWHGLPAPGWRPAPPPPAPERAAGSDVTLVTGGAAPRAAPDDQLVVRRGDTLWALAARSLGPGASAAEIAARWPQWWQANRQVIGADPDRLVPGTLLTAPPLPAPSTRGNR